MGNLLTILGNHYLENWIKNNVLNKPKQLIIDQLFIVDNV